jgi:uncharacterized membrane protein YfcA
LINWSLLLQLPIELPQLLLVWAAILFAALLRSFTGFGFALAAVPVFSLFLSPVESVVLCASLSLGIGLTTFPTYYDKKCIRSLVPLLLMALIGTPTGALLLSNLPPQYFKRGIGVAVVMSCVFLVLYKPKYSSSHTTHPLVGSVTGLVSGLLNGAFAIPGPPIIIYAMATERDPMRSRSMMISFFTISSVLALGTYQLHGFITLQSIILFLCSFPVMFLGDKIGFLLLKKFGNLFYRRIALVALFFIGVITFGLAF